MPNVSVTIHVIISLSSDRKCWIYAVMSTSSTWVSILYTAARFFVAKLNNAYVLGHHCRIVYLSRIRMTDDCWVNPWGKPRLQSNLVFPQIYISYQRGMHDCSTDFGVREVNLQKRRLGCRIERFRQAYHKCSLLSILPLKFVFYHWACRLTSQSFLDIVLAKLA